VIVDGQTVGISISGNRFPLEENIRKMSLRSNCLLVGFLDCCRQIPAVQKGLLENRTKGQLFLIYAVGPGKSAITRNSSDNLSIVTNDFLQVVKKVSDPFPDCL